MKLKDVPTQNMDEKFFEYRDKALKSINHSMLRSSEKYLHFMKTFYLKLLDMERDMKTINILDLGKFDIDNMEKRALKMENEIYFIKNKFDEHMF